MHKPFWRLTAVVLLAALVAMTAAARSADKPVDAKLERLEGGKLRLSELRGKPVLLDLWATWCIPCRQQSKIIHELRGELEKRGIQIFAVDVGESEAKVREHLRTNPSEVPILLDPYQTLLRVLDVGTLPSLVLLDESGRIAGKRSGLSQADEVLALAGSVGGGETAEPTKDTGE